MHFIMIVMKSHTVLKKSKYDHLFHNHNKQIYLHKLYKIY